MFWTSGFVLTFCHSPHCWQPEDVQGEEEEEAQYQIWRPRMEQVIWPAASGARAVRGHRCNRFVKRESRRELVFVLVGVGFRWQAAAREDTGDHHYHCYL